MADRDPACRLSAEARHDCTGSRACAWPISLASGKQLPTPASFSGAKEDPTPKRRVQVSPGA